MDSAPPPAQKAATVWAISDAAAGNIRQVEALAAALGLPWQSLRVETRPPWRWLAPRLLLGAEQAFGPDWQERLHGELPDIAIGCGRQAALMTRLLRTLGEGRCRSIQILDPRIDPRAFDLIITPRHDPLRAANVINTQGSLHPIDARWLAEARLRSAPLGNLPSPRIGLLLGGPAHGVRLDAAWWTAVADSLDHWLERDGGSLLLIGSRRTPPALASMARARFGARAALCWFGPEDGENPYPGVLAYADRLIVSPDSVNLLSEACAVGVPVVTHAPLPPSGRLGDFLRDLTESGRVRPLRHGFTPWTIEPLRELDRVVTEVRRRLDLH